MMIIVKLNFVCEHLTSFANNVDVLNPEMNCITDEEIR